MKGTIFIANLSICNPNTSVPDTPIRPNSSGRRTNIETLTLLIWDILTWWTILPSLKTNQKPESGTVKRIFFYGSHKILPNPFSYHLKVQFLGENDTTVWAATREKSRRLSENKITVLHSWPEFLPIFRPRIAGSASCIWPEIFTNINASYEKLAFFQGKWPVLTALSHRCQKIVLRLSSCRRRQSVLSSVYCLRKFTYPCRK